MRKWVVGALLAAVDRRRGSDAERSSSAPPAPQLTKITLQLKWVPQAQFAGYYAASLKGFYKAAGLDVTLKNGGPNIIPETGRRIRPGAVRRRLAAEPARRA